MKWLLFAAMNLGAGASVDAQGPAFGRAPGASAPATNPSSIEAARELYASARYDEALTVLNDLGASETSAPAERKVIEQYRSLVKALDPESDDRVYYKLAERDALRLEREGATTEQTEFVQDRLDEADEHVEQGRIAEARKLWQCIVSLYRDDEHLLPLVQVAEENLRATEDVPQK